MQPIFQNITYVMLLTYVLHFFILSVKWVAVENIKNIYHLQSYKANDDIESKKNNSLRYSIYISMTLAGRSSMTVKNSHMLDLTRVVPTIQTAEHLPTYLLLLLI